jgi:hypothetical protein
MHSNFEPQTCVTKEKSGRLDLSVDENRCAKVRWWRECRLLGETCRAPRQLSRAPLLLSTMVMRTLFAAVLHDSFLDVALLCSLLRVFLRSGSLVQQTQVCLPADRNNSSKYAPVLYGYVRETECRDRWPDFAAIDPARGYGVLYALDNFGN